jgi:hypothetical protein
VNTIPMLHDQQVTPTSDGRIAMDNVARAFWQSRMTRAGGSAPLPQLANLEQLARDVRRDPSPYYIQPTRALNISDALTAMFGRVHA